MNQINHDELKARIIKSGDFPAETKRYLEKLIDMQTPRRVIRENWNISKCPCCDAELGEWLEDGYHKDYEYLEICNCGQKLNWSYQEEDEDEAN